MLSRFIDHTNKEWFWFRLKNENEVIEACKYLADNNLKIEIKGKKVLIEGIDLSGNGFTLFGNKLLFHVRYFRKLQELSKTDEFKKWINKQPTYDLVKSYIIEKKSRNIDFDKIKDLIP